MRQVYAERMNVLVETTKKELAGRLDVQLATSGMRTIGWLPKGEKDREIAERARSQGLEIAAISQFALRQSAPNGLILGFAGSAPAELRRGVDVLASVLS